MGRKKKKRGRYPKRRPEQVYRRWMPYEAALLFIRTVEGITSRGKYRKWHDEVEPYYLPKMPERVYKGEWTSWNDFLGVDNSWDGWDRQRKKQGGWWMPYWEAVRFVQKLHLKNKNEYKQAYTDGLISDHIPRAPDQTYGDEWTGWKSFLGSGIVEKVASAEKVTGILCLCSSSLLPPNVLEVIIAPEGRGQLQDKLDGRNDLRPYRAYVWEANIWPQVKSVMSALGSEQAPNVFMFSNVNAIVYELDNLLMIYRGR